MAVEESRVLDASFVVRRRVARYLEMMAMIAGGVRFGVLAVLLGTFVACGGDGDDDHGGVGEAGRGGAGGGARGGTGGSGKGSSLDLPSRLPSDDAECASTTGSDGCFFDACCDVLVACHDNADCAKAFGCYASCGPENTQCFVSCAGSSLEDGADDFAAALQCALPAGLGCGSDTPPDDNPDDTPPDVGELGSAEDDLGWDLTVSSDPLTAELEADEDRAESELVTLDGGTLSVQAADGTVFELIIPEGALYEPTVITLTPLSAFEVSGLEGSAYGVRIEPDGLAMMGSPTLEITPPDGEEWAVDQQLPLAVTGEADLLSLAPIVGESESLRLALTHFSSYGVLISQKGMAATLSEADIRSRFGGAAAERIESAVAERLAHERQRQLLGSSEASLLENGIDELWAEYEAHVVKPRVAKAGESCAAGKLAIQTVLGMDRQRQLLGDESSSEFQFLDLLPTVTDVCLREEYELCRDDHIITRILPVYFGVLRQSQLLGLGTEVDGVAIPPTWVLTAEEYAKKCLSFELQFDSNVTYSDGSPEISMNETVTARVTASLQATLSLIPAETLPPGAATLGALILGPAEPLESTTYAVYTSERCRTIDSEQAEDGQLQVGFLSFTPVPSTPESPGVTGEIEDVGISLAISPNLSAYAYTNRREEDNGCGELVSSGGDVLSWSSTLGAHFLNTSVNGENGVWITGWEPVNGDIIASKDLSLSYGDDDVTGRGPVRMVLFHAPK